MGALWLSLVIFGMVPGVAVAGVLLAPTLAAPARSDFNAREFFKAIRAIVIGVTSLSLGLLVTNAKSDFQKHRDELRALRAFPCFPSTPGRTRTCNPRFRRPMLYPIELRARLWSRVQRHDNRA